jgi:hypothetical protein
VKHSVFVICDISASPKLTYLTHNGKIWTSDLEEAAIWFNKTNAQLYIEKFVTDIFHRQLEIINREGINKFTSVKYNTVYENYFRLKRIYKPLEVSV